MEKDSKEILTLNPDEVEELLNKDIEEQKRKEQEAKRMELVAQAKAELASHPVITGKTSVSSGRASGKSKSGSEKVKKASKYILPTVLIILTLALIFIVVMYFIGGNIVKKAQRENVNEVILTEENELFNYLGTNYETLADKLGSSVPRVSANIRYFEDPNVSIIAETEGKITYIDIDGCGNPTMCLMGVTCEMGRDQVQLILGGYGITEPQKSDEETDYYYLNNDTTGELVELAITYSNEQVVLISAYIMEK